MADRPAPQPPQNRDLVFCHQCENEWYRDEHGLTCPECQGDFTEIIEPNSDPREDPLHLPSDPQPPPPRHPLGDHNPWQDAPDPDEEDIDGLRYEEVGPGRYRVTGSVNRTFNSRQELEQAQGGTGLLGMIGNAIGGFIGGGQQQQQGEHYHQPPQSPRSPSLRPDGSQRRASSTPGSPRTSGTTFRTINGPGGFHMQIMTSTHGTINGQPLHPRNANGPQPFQNQPDDLNEMMAQMLMNIGIHPGHMHGHPPHPAMGGPPGMARGFPPGFGGPMFPGGAQGHDDGMPRQPGFAAGGAFFPFNLLGGILGGANGQMGDAVYTQEALDRIVTQLMEQHQTGNAPGPASEAAIKSLPTRKITESDMGADGKADCSICMDSVSLDDEVTVLPCSHWFHGECVKAWLSEHDTCPHCRQGIMPKESTGADTQRPRDPSQPPLHDTLSPEYQRRPSQQMPGGFPTFARQGSGDGSRQNPWTVPDSPTMNRHNSTGGSRRASSSGRQGSSSGGMFARMRDTFGSGGGSGSGHT